MRYNITTDEGVRTSVTAFTSDGAVMAATAEHPSFNAICDLLTLRDGAYTEQEVIDLFDVSRPLSRKFEHLSERVTVNAGRVFFDGDAVDDSLATAIMRFHEEQLADFRPLVNFMEKIHTNPNEHSRANLYTWLAKHHYAIAEDGDFIAYKSVDDAFFSLNSGTAMVNGEVIHGHIPNLPDTIIEMPRSDVAFNPSDGCSTGLHVANWRFALHFGGKTMLRIKVNPRDVVSVPTDSDAEKMRVCRYRVLDVVTTEDAGALWAGAEPTRRVSAADIHMSDEADAILAAETPRKRKTYPAKKKKEIEFPAYWEEMKRIHFASCGVRDLRWLAKEWGIKGADRMSKAVLVAKLTIEAVNRKKTWK